MLVGTRYRGPRGRQGEDSSPAGASDWERWLANESTRGSAGACLQELLSCPCDVTAEQERAVFDYLLSIPQGQAADYAPVLAAFGPNTSTPFHRLAAFSSWRAPDPAEVTIERQDVLRVNASGYHWDLAASGLPNAYKKIRSVPSWRLAHTLLPVTVHKAAEDGGMVARYTFADGEVSVGERVLFRPSLR